MKRAKLRWRCRRGTKELDDTLLRFLDEAFSDLDERQQWAFESLLDQQDPDLAAWILGGRQPPDEWRGIVGRIRNLIRR